MTAVAVSDTGPLIHLGEIDSLELLTHLDRLYVPETVFEELDEGGVPDGLTSILFERIVPETPFSGTDELDAGERAALAVAREYDAILLTDDLAAREIALESGLEVRGSLGVIARAHAEGLVDRDGAAERMRSLQRETSLFVTDTIVERGIRLLDKN